MSLPPKSNTPTDPIILRIQKLAQQRHAQSIGRAQKTSQGEFARQERADKAIAEFLAWNPPGNFWWMQPAENCESVILNRKSK
jgi:hypothetical protein